MKTKPIKPAKAKTKPAKPTPAAPVKPNGNGAGVVTQFADFKAIQAGLRTGVHPSNAPPAVTAANEAAIRAAFANEPAAVAPPLSKVTPDKPKSDKPQVLADTQAVSVNVAVLRACLTVAAKERSGRALLESLHLRTIDGQFRVMSSDGHRALVVPVKSAGIGPKWASEGVLLALDGLDKFLALVDSVSSVAVIEYGAGNPHATVHDAGRNLSMKVRTIEGKFPDLDGPLRNAATSLSREGATPLATAAVNPVFMASAGRIGSALDATSVLPFGGVAGSAWLFTFTPSERGKRGIDKDDVAGAVLLVMAMNGDGAVSTQSARILAPAVRLSIAALKAHKTRVEQQLTGIKGKDPAATKQRDDLTHKSKLFADRIAALTAATSKQITHQPSA